MKLRSLAVNQFKKFNSPMRLDGIDDGLNIVVGPNEMGKSTLLDALRAALFEKHASKAKSIIALQNDRNMAGPVVELAFELDEGLYRIVKRFVKKPYARLSCPDGRTLEGEAAEDMLRTLLNFDDPGNTGAKPETLGMWNVLWVQQGQSFGALDLPESARSNLHGALESEVGAVLGGRRGRALPQAIETQLRELVTGNGKPRGTYKDLIEHIDTIQEEFGALGTRRQDLSKTLDDLEDTQETLARLTSTEHEQEDQMELDGARQRHGRLAKLETEIGAASSELELKKRNLEQAERAAADRERLREGIASKKRTLREAEKRRTAVHFQEKDARTQLDRLLADARKADAAVTAADEIVSSKRRAIGVVQRQARIRELEGRCAKALSAEQRFGEANRNATAILVTDKAIDAIRVAAKELATVTSRLSAAATLISFDVEASRRAGIEIDGRPLPAEQPSVHAVEPTTIAIPEYGRIMVEPAIRDRDKLLLRERDAKSKLRSALERTGAATVGEAEEQYVKRQRLVQEAELAQQEALLHAPSTDDHDAGAQRLADFIESQRQILERDMDELGSERLPLQSEAEAALRTAEDQAQQARRDLEIARAAMAGPDDALRQLQTELGTVNARYEDAEERLDELRCQLQDAKEKRSDDELLSGIEVARVALWEQENNVTELKAKRTDETLPQLAARIERLEKAIRDRREKRANLEVKIASLKSRVEMAEGAGLAEAIEGKNRELELRTEECARHQRDVQVLDLLLSTLRTAEQEAKERYLSPVLNRVQPYLQLLFPGADVRIDENLHIVGIVREPGYEEAFHRLSMGTQEQIAVLVRLAFAEMLVEQGRPATVVLDDALVFSDDRRMRRMFDILNMAARNIQVIIFTCREQLFDELGARQLALQPGNAEELVSA